MIITIRKERGKYQIVNKENGEVKGSFETKAEALAWKEDDTGEKSKRSSLGRFMKKE